MRYIHVLRFFISDVAAYRAEAFVWFLLSLLNTISVLIVWMSGIRFGVVVGEGISIPWIQQYYLGVLVVFALLVSHISREISEQDIKQGGITMYLLRPCSYYLLKAMHELSWRLAEGGMALLTVTVLFVVVGDVGAFDPVRVGLTLVLCVLGYLISFTLKMTMGLLAFWFTETWGLYELVHALELLFGGVIMPLSFFPQSLQVIQVVLPFAATIYFPVQALLGRVSAEEMIYLIGIQVMWLVILGVCYHILWTRGLKAYAGVSV